MPNPDHTKWSAWRLFCISTNREALWSKKVCSLLKSASVLPTDTVLDVGCGTGEFIQGFSQYARSVYGIDVDDYRTVTGFNFKAEEVENYSGPVPDLIIFKQVIHLLNDPFNIVCKYPNATVVVMQMPVRSMNGVQSIQDNRIRFNRLGYATEIHELSLEFYIPPERYEQMVMGGYTSTLEAMTVQERRDEWNRIRAGYDSNYMDKLGVLVAFPASSL
jgi:SAM-dependent methyltransferase